MHRIIWYQRQQTFLFSNKHFPRENKILCCSHLPFISIGYINNERNMYIVTQADKLEHYIIQPNLPQKTYMYQTDIHKINLFTGQLSVVSGTLRYKEWFCKGRQLFLFKCPSYKNHILKSLLTVQGYIFLSVLCHCKLFLKLAETDRWQTEIDWFWSHICWGLSLCLSNLKSDTSSRTVTAQKFLTDDNFKHPAYLT